MIPLKAFLGTAWIWFSLRSLERQTDEQNISRFMGSTYRYIGPMIKPQIFNLHHTHPCSQLHKQQSLYKNKGAEDHEEEEEEGWTDIYDQWNNLLQRASKTKRSIRNPASAHHLIARSVCCVINEEGAARGNQEVVCMWSPLKSLNTTDFLFSPSEPVSHHCRQTLLTMKQDMQTRA